MSLTESIPSKVFICWKPRQPLSFPGLVRSFSSQEGVCLTFSLAPAQRTLPPPVLTIWMSQSAWVVRLSCFCNKAHAMHSGKYFIGILLAIAWSYLTEQSVTYCLYCCLLSNYSSFLPKALFPETYKQIRIKDTPHSVILTTAETHKGAESASKKL